ncbi:flavin reductase [Spirochaetia bacterium]|nr:flavin reductase [Spirochaetia bacterium]
MKQKPVIPAGSEWVEKNAREFPGTPFARIGDEWTLITAGSVRTGKSVTADKGNWNTMTASWGSLGVLWGKDVAFIFIRPVRHTFEFANANPLFTLSFFDKSYHKALAVCGAKSGRDIDKAAETGITPIVFKDGSIGFKEATEVITCRKLYTQDFDPSKFLEPWIDTECYPQKDYHRMYVGEITSLRVRG